MKIFAPNYYKNFKCIADKCQHNCCIGWEIDIDEYTLEKYKCQKEISNKISLTSPPHFILESNGRCPFLNNKNLCEIIENYGEDSLCQICRDHPRFLNFYDTRSEYGVGLVCESATKLILDTDFSLEVIGEDAFEEEANVIEFEFFNERDTLFNTQPSDLVGQLPDISLSELADFFLKLERLDNSWDEYLIKLKNCNDSIKNIKITDKKRFKNLFCYFLYRHLQNTSLEFCILCVYFIFALEGDIYEICRMFSGEIEYSDENIEKILEFINHIKL